MRRARGLGKEFLNTAEFPGTYPEIAEGCGQLAEGHGAFYFYISYWVILMSKQYLEKKGKFENPVATLRALAEGAIRVGPEIDTGLHRRPATDFFLKGPIPLAELIPVSQMPGKTLTMWLMIVHRVTFSKSAWVTLPAYILKEWGVSQDAKTDALRRLEQAGQIAVSRPKGGYLKVRLLWGKRGEKADDGKPRS